MISKASRTCVSRRSVGQAGGATFKVGTGPLPNGTPIKRDASELQVCTYLRPILYLTLIHLHFIHVYAPRTKQQNSTLSCTTNSLQRTSSIDLLTSRICFCYPRLFRKPRGRSITPAQDSRSFATRANAIDDQVYYRRHLPMYRYS